MNLRLANFLRITSDGMIVGNQITKEKLEEVFAQREVVNQREGALAQSILNAIETKLKWLGLIECGRWKNGESYLFSVVDQKNNKTEFTIEIRVSSKAATRAADMFYVEHK